jgi:hypothetical protein
LTIVNLLISRANETGNGRSASILARKPPKMNPPYAGCRIAADAGYKVRGVKDARRATLNPSVDKGGGGLQCGLSIATIV